MSSEDSIETTGRGTPLGTIDVPRATAWPLVLAFGLTTVAAGLMTGESVSILGGALVIAGILGWFRALFPAEAHERVPVELEQVVIATARPQVERVAVAPDAKRVWLPIEIYPISAGVKGGLAGCVVMAVLAMAYGLLSHTSIWYPINLLVAGFFPETASASTSQLAQFSLEALLIAIPLHLIMSLMAGLLYGAMLPMVPRHPILLGGLIAPVMWSGLVYSILGIVNPVMDQRINWLWFALSQLGFGLAAGLVVSRQERVRTEQGMPFLLRAGVESPDLRGESRHEDQQP